MIPIGAKVIYFKSLDDKMAPARVGTLTYTLDDGRMVIKDLISEGRTTVRSDRVFPYSDALWSAWLQWQQNAFQMVRQYQQLLAGQAPAELLGLNVFDQF